MSKANEPVFPAAKTYQRHYPPGRPSGMSLWVRPDDGEIVTDIEVIARLERERDEARLAAKHSADALLAALAQETQP